MGLTPTRPTRTKQPLVILDFDLVDDILLARIINLSDQALTDVSFAFRQKFRILGGQRNLSDLAIMTGLKYLAPGRRIDVPLDRASVFFALNKGNALTVSVRYRDVKNQDVIATLHHDLGIWRDFPDVVRQGG